MTMRFRGPPFPARKLTMKDLAPDGCTRTPKPVTLSSQAIQGLAAGSSASIAGMVSSVRSFAARLPAFPSIRNRWRALAAKSTNTDQQTV